MKKHNALLIAVLFCFGLIFCALAEVDTFNTYQWNKKNVLAGNGQVDTSPWFEWWYYKVVLPESGESFFFVYGVVNPWDNLHKMPGTRSYVGMGDFRNKLMAGEEYPVSAFAASYDDVSVEVNKNIASDKNLQGNLVNPDGKQFSWNMSVEKQWSYNATGWATGAMLTNIEWYPAQAGALCSGTIVSDGRVHDFSGAPCYQDRNWGESFPKWWAWVVSNKFENFPDSVLAVGGGQPKALGTNNAIQGVSIGLRHKGVDYAFRPNYLDHVHMNINFGKWEMVAEDSMFINRIEISAWAPEEKFLDLKFMTPEGTIFHDYETLTGYVKVKLYHNVGSFFAPSWELLDILESRFAGIEYGSKEILSYTKRYHLL